MIFIISKSKSAPVSAILLVPLDLGCGGSCWTILDHFLKASPPPRDAFWWAILWVSLDPLWITFLEANPPNICDLACILGSNLDQLWEATPPQGLRFRGSPCFPPLPPLPSPPFPLPNPTASEQAGRQDRVAPSVDPLVSSHRFCAIVASSIAWLHRWGVLFRTKLVVRF